MAKSYDILAVGNAIVDVLAQVDDAFLTQHGVPKGEMRLIDESRARALYGDLPPAVEISGGSAANTCAGVASLGGRVRFVGKVANDQLGDVFAHDLRAAGVLYDVAPLADGPATARSIIAITPDAQRSMSTFLGASVHVGLLDISPKHVAETRIVYLEGYLFDAKATKEAFRRTARLADEHEAMTAITLSDPFCVHNHRADFQTFVADHTDILFANEAEIMALYETDTFEAAKDAVRGQCRIAVLTRSEKGCVIVSDEDEVSVPAAPVDEVVDTTGAGDLFASGFLFGVANDRPLVQCGQLGALAAAEIISHIGARPQKNLADLARQASIL